MGPCEHPLNTLLLLLLLRWLSISLARLFCVSFSLGLALA